MGFKGAFYPNFSAPPSCETMHWNTFWRCKNGTDFLYHHAKFDGPRISHAAMGRKTLTFFVTLLNGKVCERHLAISALENGNNLGIVG